MEKLVAVVLIACTISLILVRGIYAQQKGGSRVIYEESTTLKDAKHRSKILSEIEAQNSQGADNPEQKKCRQMT
ncbi:MAG: hypothetical protein V1739_03415 [Candidatus Omnitrophota bacterium]